MEDGGTSRRVAETQGEKSRSDLLPHLIPLRVSATLREIPSP